MPAIILCLLCLLLPEGVAGQKFFSQQFSTTDGLGSDEVRDVLCSRPGFPWIATDGGLYRFDGRRFTSYNRLLKSHYIRDLIRWQDSLILFSNDTGVHTLCDEPGVDRIVTLIPGGVEASDTSLLYPNVLYLDGSRRLWISQPDGRLACWQDERLRHYAFPINSTTRRSNSAFTIAESRSGHLFVGSPRGEIYRYDGRADSFQLLRPSYPAGQIHVMFSQGDTLWLGGDQLIQVNIQGGNWKEEKTYDTGGLVLSSFLSTDDPGRLLAGTKQQGLYQLTFKGERIELQQVFGSNDPHRIDVLPFREIHGLYRDAQNNIWLSTAQGLGLLQTRFFETVFGLANNNTLAVFPAKEEEVLVSYGEVYTLRSDGFEFSSQLLPLDEEFITGLTATSDRLWMSTTDGRLFPYHQGRKGREVDLTDRGGGIFFIYADHEDNIWICQAPDDNPIVGIACRSPDGRLREFGRAEGLDNRILVVSESPRGRLYAAGIGPKTYLYRYQPEDDTFLNLSLPLPFAYSEAFEVHDLAIDERGIVWLGTTDGLLRYDLERIQRVPLGLHTTAEIRSLTAMPDGSLWLATDTEGLLYYQEHTQSYSVLSEESGLPSIIAVYRSLRRSPSGRLWLGTAEGVVHSRDSVPRPLSTQAPVLLALTVNNQFRESKKAIELGQQSTLQLHWASPMFPGQLIRYRYRLKNEIDSSWVDLNTEDQLQLSRLPFGSYELEIQALQEGGYTWSDPLQLFLEVRPPWFRRWWAIALYTLLGVLLLYYLFQLNIGRLLRRIRLLEADLAVREQEIQQKEAQLQRQSLDLEERHEALEDRERQRPIASAGPEEQIIRLHELLSDISPHAQWTAVLPVLAKHLLDRPGMDAFEIAWPAMDHIHFRGFRRGEKEPYSRQQEFNQKSCLAVWVLTHKQGAILQHYSSEILDYLETEEGHGYQAVICLPFEVRGRQLLAFQLLSQQPDQFGPSEQLLLESLLKYLSLAIEDQFHE